MNKKSFIFILIFGLLNFFYPIYSYAYPSNAMVKVGIMDQKYTTTEKSEISVYSTSEMILTDLKTKEELGRIPPNTELKISRVNNKYELYYIEPLTEIEMGAELEDDFILSSPDGILGISNLIRGGKSAQYRGDFRIISVPDKSDKFYLINCLDVEDYLKGVVPSEMPVGFGLEALKSQAIAARVYSLTPRTKTVRAYDVVDSVASQVYYGYNRESDIANKAIDETHGLVALHNDEMIVAVFCSTAGGYTESYSNTFSDPTTQQFPSPERKYLISTPDLPEIKPLNNEEDAFNFYSTKPQSYDIQSPLYRWTKTWSKEELQKVLKSTLIVQSKTGFVEPKLLKSEDFGNLKRINVTKRGASGKIITMEIVTDKNTFTIGKELVIRRIFQKEGKALPSANVVFKYKKNNEIIKLSDNSNKTTADFDEIVAYGGGFGHGCGLSQFGAKYMAQTCKLPFDTILKHYYNGIELGTKPVEVGKNSVNISFFQPFEKAFLVIPKRNNIKLLTMNINGEDYCFNLGETTRSETDISKYIKTNDMNIITVYGFGESSHNKKHPVPEQKIKLYIKVIR